MNRCQRRGVAMVLVITLIGMVGVMLAFLGQHCRLMIAQTDRQFQKATDRNLVLSGLAWAKRQGAGTGDQGSPLRIDDGGSRIGGPVRDSNPESAIPNPTSLSLGGKGEAVTLDVNELAKPGARLSVAVVDANDASAVRITTFVPSVRYDLNRSRTFRITRP